MFPSLFDDDDEYEDEPAITQSQIDELQEEMAAINASIKESSD